MGVSFRLVGLVFGLLFQPPSSVAFLPHTPSYLIFTFSIASSLSFVFVNLILFCLLACSSDWPAAVFWNTLLLCYCTLPDSNSKFSCPTSIMLPSWTDGSPGKQCSQDTLLVLQVRGHHDSLTSIIIWTMITAFLRRDVLQLDFQ